jgi:hypothetical protein
MTHTRQAMEASFVPQQHQVTRQRVLELEVRIQALISEIAVLTHFGMEAEVDLLEGCLQEAEADLGHLRADGFGLAIGRLCTEGAVVQGTSGIQGCPFPC